MILNAYLYTDKVEYIFLISRNITLLMRYFIVIISLNHDKRMLTYMYRIFNSIN